MRKVYAESNGHNAAEFDRIENLYPWAEFISACEGGYMCFESEEDFVVWENQK
jgi:hypothetical protein